MVPAPTTSNNSPACRWLTRGGCWGRGAAVSLWTSGRGHVGLSNHPQQGLGRWGGGENVRRVCHALYRAFSCPQCSPGLPALFPRGHHMTPVPSSEVCSCGPGLCADAEICFQHQGGRGGFAAGKRFRSPVETGCVETRLCRWVGVETGPGGL